MRWLEHAWRQMLVLALAIAPAWSLAAPAPVEETLVQQSRSSLRNYGPDEGLPQVSVNAIRRTHDGFLWLGTFGGLVRFDGREFRVFRSAGRFPDGSLRDGPSSERVLALYEDVRQRLWIGTHEGGVSLYERGRFRHLPICGGTCQVNSIFSLDGHAIWLMVTNGILRVDPDTLEATSYLDAFDAYAIDAQANGEAFAAGTHGLARLRPDGVHPLPLPDGNRIVRKMGSDGQSLWLVVQNGSLYRYDVAADRWTFIRSGLRPEVQLPSDGRGSVYLSDEAQGVRRLAHDGSEWPLALTSAIHGGRAYADADGTLWIGSTNKGLWRLRPARVSLLRSSTATSSPGRVVAADGAGGMWLLLGCSDLWHRSADGRLTKWPLPTVIDDQCVVSLLRDDADGSLWIGSAGRATLLRLRDGRLEKINTWEQSYEVSLWKADGRIWVAGTHFVGRLRLDKDTYADVDEVPALAGMSVKSIVTARAGGAWVVGDRGAFRVVDDAVVERWSSEQGLRGSQFRALYEDADGVLWIGSYGSGLVRIEKGQVRQYTEADGLFDDTVSCILPDVHGHLWMAGNRGISVLLDRRIGIDGPVVLVLSASEGLDPAEFNGGTAPPCAADEAGHLWFAMVIGLATLDPVAFESPGERRIPVAYIDHARVSRQAIDLWQPADLDVNAGNLEIGFGAIDLVDSDKVRFRYRLARTGDWIDAGTTRKLLLPVVPWGRFVFEVQARELGGDWSPSATLELNRPLPWYRMSWIWLAASLGCLVMLLWMTREPRRAGIDADRSADERRRSRRTRG